MDTYSLADGRCLKVDLRGPTDTGLPTIVFSNGLSQTTVSWGLQSRRLQQERRLLLWDACGQGRSDPPPDVHRPAQHADDLIEILDGLGIDRVDLVGFSFGARTTLRTVLAIPERVRRVVLVGVAHRETVLRRWIVRGWMDALEKGGHEHVFRMVTPLVVGETWLERNEGLYAGMLKGFTRRNDPVAMQRLMMDSILPGGDLGDELRTLPHSTLIIRGEFDLVVPDWLNRELVELLPHALYEECPGVGHSVAIEAADWLTEQLRTHLAG